VPEVAALQVTADPAGVGVDTTRLARIDRHFAGYVEDGRLAGWQVVVARHGQVVHSSVHGRRDVEADLPVEQDTLWRIYSMTKPITSVAALSMLEEGAFELNDPVSRFIPSFADVRVWAGGSSQSPRTVAATEPVRMWHLLSHTSGLTYGFMNAHPVDTIYRDHGFDFGTAHGLDLAACVDAWAGLPLLFNPGEQWSYSVATDVLGRVLEVIAGKGLDQVLAERVLDPLGMSDTRWWVDTPDADRLAALYAPHPATGKAVRLDAVGQAALRAPVMLSGGGGLVSTAGDYLRFTEMLRRGGELDGVRVLGPRILAYATRNHLPGGADLTAFGSGQFSEVAYGGVGFGLGFAVTVDPTAGKTVSSPGEFTWGGAASTAFWVDPVEDLVAIFLTQLLPSSTHPIRTQLRTLVHQALVD
jgi:CubicO group peptidase (beta-lactamase class C family)